MILSWLREDLFQGQLNQGQRIDYGYGVLKNRESEVPKITVELESARKNGGKEELFLHPGRLEWLNSGEWFTFACQHWIHVFLNSFDQYTQFWVYEVRRWRAVEAKPNHFPKGEVAVLIA